MKLSETLEGKLKPRVFSTDAFVHVALVLHSAWGFTLFSITRARLFHCHPPGEPRVSTAGHRAEHCHMWPAAQGLPRRRRRRQPTQLWSAQSCSQRGKWAMVRASRVPQVSRHHC